MPTPASSTVVTKTRVAVPARLAVCLLGLSLWAGGTAAAEWQSLFNGRDFSGWDRFLSALPGSAEPLG